MNLKGGSIGNYETVLCNLLIQRIGFLFFYDAIN
jgi:hypothetical protein